MMHPDMGPYGPMAMGPGGLPRGTLPPGMPPYGMPGPGMPPPMGPGQPGMPMGRQGSGSQVDMALLPIPDTLRSDMQCERGQGHSVQIASKRFPCML